VSFDPREQPEGKKRTVVTEGPARYVALTGQRSFTVEECPDCGHLLRASHRFDGCKAVIPESAAMEALGCPVQICGCRRSSATLVGK
jgi:hypothetical protein